MKSKHILPTVLALAVSAVLTGCGGGGSSSGPNVSTPPINGNSNGGNGSNGNGSNGGNGNGGNTPAAVTPDLVIVDKGPTSKVKVGVIDSGADTHNATLNGSVSKVLNFGYVPGGETKVSDITGADSTTQEMADSRHGTFVSQIIAGNTTNGSTAGGALGVADIYAAQTTISGLGTSYAHINFEAMRHLQQKYGVQLFNGSWGNSDNKIADALTQKFAAEVVKNGGLIVLAAGNDAKLFSSDMSQMPSYISGLEQGFLTVVGLDQFHIDLYYNPENNTGSNACGATAARWCLASDYVNGPYYDKNDGNQLFGGTSGAAPTVTATAALVWSKYPWLTNDQVRQTILTTADYIDDGSGDVLYNDRFGWGTLDTEEALKGPSGFYTLFGNYFKANVDNSQSMYVFSNDIVGDAGLDKSGAGTLVLSGDNSYTGETDVMGGKLVITGSVASNVNVGLGGHLTGNGIVNKNVNNSGIISTGHGALKIKGDFAQSGSGTLAYTLNKNLDITGKAGLDGTLSVIASDSKYVSKGEHLVLDADGGVVGKFSNVKASAFLKTTGITYGSNDVKVGVDHADATASGTNASSITYASGEVLNNLFAQADEQYKAGLADSTLVQYVGNLQSMTTVEQAQAVLNVSNGALFATTPAVILQNQSLSNSQIARRAYALNKDVKGGAWVNYAEMKKETDFDGLDTVKSETNSVSLGVDAPISDNAVAGLYASFYKENSDFGSVQSSNELDMNTLGLYGTWNGNGLAYLSGHAYVGVGDGKFTRQVFNGTGFETVKSSSDILQSGIYGETGLRFNAGVINFTPYLGASFNYLGLDAVKENNQYGLSIDDVNAKETKYHVGFRTDAKVTQTVTVGGFVEYANKVGSGNQEVTIESNLAAGAKSTYKVKANQNDYTLYGLNFNYTHTNGKWNIFADVAGISDSSDSYQGQVGLKMAF